MSNDRVEQNAPEPILNTQADISQIYSLHWVIIGLSLLLTFSAWFITSTQAEEKSVAKFTRESEQVVSHIRERMGQYEDALWAGAAYIAAVDNKFDADEWGTYAANLSIEKKYPGINGIGVIYSIPNEQLQLFEQTQRITRPSFEIYPAHNEEIGLPITYIEPLLANKKALGLDVAHEHNRFTAAMNSKKSGQAQITGPIVLVQDNESTPGFLFYVPFYSDNLVKTELRHDENSFLGLVYAPFIFKKLMNGLLSEESRLVKLTITDGENTLYDENNKHANGRLNSKHDKNFDVNMYGRTWVINISTTPSFESATNNNKPIVILVTGLTIDILLFFVFLTLARSRKQSVRYADKVTQEIQQKNKEYEVLAHFDFLTNLPNRMSFLLTLSQTLLQGHSMRSKTAVCFIDIDNFKMVNDNLGHTIGDRVLIKLADRLKGIIGEHDYLARYGGDEFGLIIHDASNIDKVLLLLNACIATARRPVLIDSAEINTSISIGIAVYPYGGKTAEELISNADIAMYRAKVLGKNSFEFFNKRMNESVKRRHMIDNAMRHAISNNELYLLYQPQIDIRTNTPVGIEALLRWNNPGLGELLPEEFISLAEENGLMSEIGQWVINTSISDFSEIQKDTCLGNLKLSINISAKELEHPQTIPFIQQVFSKSTIRPSNIYFELTESALMNNIGRTKQIMVELNELGAHFSLDDFGTGYSSLQYLKSLPIKQLKLDKVFIRDIITDKDDAIIVKATIQLAHALGLKIIAEGVETRDQLEYLKAHDCDQVQGFYHSVPLNREALIHWILQHTNNI